MKKILCLFLVVMVSMGIFAQDTYHPYRLEKDVVAKELALLYLRHFGMAIENEDDPDTFEVILDMDEEIWFFYYEGFEMLQLHSHDARILRMAVLEGSEYEAQVKRDGYLYDQPLALAVARLIWVDVYGQRVLNQEPFRASQQAKIWLIRGSLPTGMDGGVPYLRLRQSDGMILGHRHDQ
ncbi:NTF2 fold immunity protein [Entomospira culicis]|uniref:NTF2 fold domain-containing protein n=1 Tax=Entomospira culicis TaxID=2719989 RepID=A0A968GG28_9SPIO|nr:NTF2 fold immunity protein [Entomospira culicis]NIZ19189.1 hypothetical protein [Entomospira culicis]NIZ69403.1 hypothetical protein [Entomospira culicis]WDI36520.1 NTF2 fold immunity protein [Entomospira culicis]WDI38146.1 NTF2 fold immunity protein [Entomospira culicis]